MFLYRIVIILLTYVTVANGDIGPGYGTSHSRLLRNLGPDSPGHFEDVTDAAGVSIEWQVRRQPFAPAFVDPGKVAALPDGTYHLRFRGGNDYTYRVTGGRLEIEDGRNGKADAVMSAAPETFAMISLGRGNQIAAALTGKVVAYGRKPWRLLALGNIVADGV